MKGSLFMNEELKKYVNAYMDGEEVQWRYEETKAVSIWHTISKLSDFEMSGAYINFRIKPKAEDKWQRVIDEGYLCKFWDYGYYESTKIGYLDAGLGVAGSTLFDGFTTISGSTYDNCEVIREKGIKQPYFQEDDIPEIDGCVIIYNAKGHHEYVNDDHIVWSEVVAYIEV